MNKTLLCQNILAAISSVLVSLISFVYLFKEDVDFMKFSSQQKIAYCSLIILWLVTFSSCVYNILYLFWSFSTCCWRSGSNNSSNFTLCKGCGYLIGIIAFCILVFFMWYQPLNFAEHIIISADLLMSNVVFIFMIGILGYLLREYCCQEEKKEYNEI